MQAETRDPIVLGDRQVANYSRMVWDSPARLYAPAEPKPDNPKQPYRARQDRFVRGMETKPVNSDDLPAWFCAETPHHCRSPVKEAPAASLPDKMERFPPHPANSVPRTLQKSFMGDYNVPRGDITSKINRERTARQQRSTNKLQYNYFPPRDCDSFSPGAPRAMSLHATNLNETPRGSRR